MKAATTEMAAVNRRTRPSTIALGARVSPSGFSASNHGVATLARRTPATPPSRLSIRLSVKSKRTRCAKLAPRAARTAISRRRPAARADSRLARFAHAISRTKATTAESTRSARRSRPTSCRYIGTTLIVQPVFVAGN
jgi:hypothetical protein